MFPTVLFSARQMHKQTDLQEERVRIERILGAVTSPDLIQKVLNFAMSVGILRHTFLKWGNEICVQYETL